MQFKWCDRAYMHMCIIFEHAHTLAIIMGMLIITCSVPIFRYVRSTETILALNLWVRNPSFPPSYPGPTTLYMSLRIYKMHKSCVKRKRRRGIKISVKVKPYCTYGVYGTVTNLIQFNFLFLDPPCAVNWIMGKNREKSLFLKWLTAMRKLHTE